MGNCCNKDKYGVEVSDIGAKSSLRQKQQKIEIIQPLVEDDPKKNESQIKLVVNNAEQLHTTNDNNISKRQSSHSDNSCSSIKSNNSKGNGGKGLTIADFVIDRALGKGAFGQVFLVTKKDTDRKYAMKSIRKLDMVKLQLIEAIILEKTILLRSSNPFVVSLKYCIQTEKKIYLIMEYVQGGEVFTLLKHFGCFTEKIAKFIIAEIILGIQYLHETLKIIYRDLKPENILLTKTGHIKISDFGLSKEFFSKVKPYFVTPVSFICLNNLQDEKTYTFAGTPEYLAPEIVLSKGHNKNVDLWGIGIFLYELVAGHPPFQDRKRNIEKIQKQIIMNKPVYPDTFSPNMKDLIQRLLQSDPQQRLGAESFFDLKEHPFFYDVDWEALQRQEVESPIKKYTDQEKLLKALRPRAILETPLSSEFQMPRINGMTYNNDDIQSDKMNPQQEAECNEEKVEYRQNFKTENVL